MKASFNVRTLEGLNKTIDNVFYCPSPYQKLLHQDSGSPRMVVFFGNDMKGVLGFGVSSTEAYIAKVNDCLEYVRHNFKDYDLCYKPHPGDEGEQNCINLSGFRVIDGKTTAEIFMAQHLTDIRAVFTVGSFSGFNGYNMGLDSHVFYHCFSDIYHSDFITSLDQSFFEMPDSFFIRTLNQPLINNSRTLPASSLLEEELKRNLQQRSGTVWILCSFSEYTVLLGILSKLIKKIDPGRKIGFIGSYHHRWEALRGYLNTYFDVVVFLSRIHYSIRPSRLWQAITIARQIKKFPITKDDILIVASQPDFVENCFVSYHPDALKIGLAHKRDFAAQYDPNSLTYTAYKEFSFNKATWFYNHIFEPLLSIHRSLFLSFTSMDGFYFNRYQRPLNEIFDRLILFHTP